GRRLLRACGGPDVVVRGRATGADGSDRNRATTGPDLRVPHRLLPPDSLRVREISYVRHVRVRYGITRTSGRQASRIRVTGPSLTSSTAMCAPNRPVATSTPRSRSRATTASTSGSATGPGAAPFHDGRRPLRVSA